MENFITEVDVLDEAKECFLTYSSEVLTDRAIPAAEDGLLSSQRKILWTMEDYLKMDSKSKTKKCNAIVGSTLATSYFHGDASCYGVLCKMSQKYLMRYPLVHPQGSLGTQEDNDLVASSRYTEAKPSIYTDLMMLDYKKNPVPTKETYNGEFMEPIILPSFFPNALCNGRQAIGISMAHSSLPHNLTEVCDAILAYIENPDLSIDEIMKYIKGPDFPLKNTVINQKDIRTAFATGKSDVSLKVRGDYEIEGNKIIFTTIPYRTYRNKIKEQLEKNVDEFEAYLDDFNDESNVGENRLVFFAKSGKVQALLNKLFQLTDLQTTVSYNMNYIVNGTPKLCSIIDLLKAYIQHQNNVMINVAKTDLEKASKREHVVEGLLIAIKDIDTAIQLIKNSDNKEKARQALTNHFNITDEQANAVLDMKLAKLTRLDKDELLKELEEVQLAIIAYNRIINDQNYRNSELSKKIIWLKENYGDERRTVITQIDEPKTKSEKVEEEIEPEKCVVVLTEAGNIKRIPATSYRAQKRNGVGVKTQDDITHAIIRTNTVDTMMIFTNKGKVYRISVNDIPVGTNTSKGQNVRSLVKMEPGEKPAQIYSIYKDTNAKYVAFLTKNGLVKKTPLEEYSSLKKFGGFDAINLREGDALASVALISDEDLICLTKLGYGIRFKSSEVSTTSRKSFGLKGMGLREGDEVIAMVPLRDASDNLAIFSTLGLGKKIALSDLPQQGRGGKGVYLYKPTSTSGEPCAMVLISDKDQLLLVGDKNTICVEAKDIPLMGRTALGNQIIQTKNLIAVSKI